MKSLSRVLFLMVLASLSPFLLPETASTGQQAHDQAFVISASRQFGILDLVTLNFTQIGKTKQPLNGIANVEGVLYALDGENNLQIIDVNTGELTLVGNTGIAVVSKANITLLTSLGKSLFALDPFNALYVVDRTTGASQFVGSTGIPAPDFKTCKCVTANSLAGGGGSLFFTWQVVDLRTGGNLVPPKLYTISPNTGFANSGVPVDAGAPVVGSGFIDNELFVFTFGKPNKIFTLDLTTGHAEFTGDQPANLDAVFGAAPTWARART